MEGFYLYCIRQKNTQKISEKGIDGGRIFTIPYQDLEAVVSQVSLEKFGLREIQRKAQENLGWIKQKAQVHEIVIEKSMRQGNGEIIPIIPMKFGTIFKAEERLVASLKKHYGKFKKILAGLTGKQEWGVKVYLNQKTFEQKIKKMSPVVQEKQKEIDQLPEGTAYFMQKQIGEAVSKEAGKALKKYLKSFFENLETYTEAGTRGKILEKELTGKFLPLVLNAIFLVSEKRLTDFIKEINKLNREYQPKGFNFEYSGPWPPYNFVA